jgi:putative FmdB family regulatory protein
MPIYTYRCENCGVQFDRHQKYEDQPLRRCPECNKKALRKVMSPVGIVFKGSGFYATDNRSPSGSHSRASAEKTEKADKAETPAVAGGAKESADAPSGTSTDGKAGTGEGSKKGD